MSQFDEILTIVPKEFEECKSPETFVSKVHDCPRCNGRGYFLPTQIGYDEWQNNPCEACNGTGKIRATVTIQWSPESSNQIKIDKRMETENNNSEKQIVEELGEGRPFILDTEIVDYNELTKLEYMAIRIAQGMVSNAPLMTNIDSFCNQDKEAARNVIATEAVELSRAIIKLCEEEQQ
jgi:RecJ-like exonuclease|nr:MAG TPA: chaperone protein [Caudoviricetes sp.]